MTGNPAQPLMDHQPKHEFFIGIDSDGCAFDTMEIKHKECFIPNIIKFFGLQAVSKFAREAAEFVNLYSHWRGINRFPAVEMVLDLLAKRAEVKARGFEVPVMPAMRRWIAAEKKPSNPALETAIKASSDRAEQLELQDVLDWSHAVNGAIEDMVHGVPPFPYVCECLAKAGERADMIVVSATPGEALRREWTEHSIDGHVAVIAGQEMGKKDEHLRLAATGKYPADKILMVGDAPGDMKAARSNGCLFYPIMPGTEDSSWKLLFDEAMDRFFAGTYQGEYEDKLVECFLAGLPETPPWEKAKG